MFSSSTNNKNVLLQGIKLLASNSPDSERQLLELLRNSKDVLRQDYSSLRHYAPNDPVAPTLPQQPNNPHPVASQARAGMAPPARPRPGVEQPIPPKAKLMKLCHLTLSHLSLA
eukprot:Phypoly_transcript_15144.p1 GENE.Phypoly_transcript_15144~~Phypoly_transcript_15144.p1  ORF type:complete len:114 (+),score=18.04 Phypoly_transcript_15144:156-497(+)